MRSHTVHGLIAEHYSLVTARRNKFPGETATQRPARPHAAHAVYIQNFWFGPGVFARRPIWNLRIVHTTHRHPQKLVFIFRSASPRPRVDTTRDFIDQL